MASPPPASDVEEITVVGKRLSEIKKQYIQAEDQLYALYNELNTEDDFDIHCAMETNAGSKLKQRVCKPVFFANAEADEAKEMLTGVPALPPEIIAKQKAEKYKMAMLNAIRKDPRMFKLIRAREERKQQYETSYKERFKDHWFAF